jgi:hypothetical protein
MLSLQEMRVGGGSLRKVKEHSKKKERKYQARPEIRRVYQNFFMQNITIQVQMKAY